MSADPILVRPLKSRSLDQAGELAPLLSRLGASELKILLGVVQSISKIEHGEGVGAAEAVAEQVLEILTRKDGRA